jgi:hypothetical protein
VRRRLFPLRGSTNLKLAAMPVDQAVLRTLRMKYKTAYESYQSCVRALTKAGQGGDKPSPELLAKEAGALRLLQKLAQLC